MSDNEENNGVEVAFASDRVTYWESRQINIGHYDSRHFGISYAKNINLKDKTISVKAKRESAVEELDESMRLVRETLDKYEAEIREKSDSYVDHDSIKKIPNEDDREDAIERRNNRRSEAHHKAQDFKDKVNDNRESRSRSRNSGTRGADRLRNRNRKKFLDE
ncbi:MAG: hypothetical protein HRU18_01785 [Pseudoalteromonas sp.]|uniref:hypothetical protein n=1 Tax=Pseudoalteromonas sp. TaxID=53249 RepID=UPI001D57DDA4|nr:hypothetical protein [Pseudoalteromonas sp.]NRA76913.1 hypothetical protein [Pseudoalteromonas sp.]